MTEKLPLSLGPALEVEEHQHGLVIFLGVRKTGESTLGVKRLRLQRFAYRVEGYGWVFVVAVLISLAIAFATVLWQTLKAAKTNPAIELKKE